MGALEKEQSLAAQLRFTPIPGAPFGVAAYGADPARVYLMGFSQGAIMSASVPLNGGVHQPRIRRKVATPAAPRGTSPYSTRERERRPTTSAPGPSTSGATVARLNSRPTPGLSPPKLEENR